MCYMLSVTKTGGGYFLGEEERGGNVTWCMRVHIVMHLTHAILPSGSGFTVL